MDGQQTMQQHRPRSFPRTTVINYVSLVSPEPTRTHERQRTPESSPNNTMQTGAYDIEAGSGCHRHTKRPTIRREAAARGLPIMTDTSVGVGAVLVNERGHGAAQQAAARPLN
jgi:hypothetical protein